MSPGHPFYRYGAAESRPGPVLPIVAGGVLRRPRLGARHRVAGGRLAGGAWLPWGLGLEATAPDHSTISRTRRLIDVETHRAVFTWIQEWLVAAGLLTGKTVAVDATTLEANAAMRNIVRRDTGKAISSS
ncbi:MAG TPA: hypothetical protein VJ650_08795 [Gemmatimonadaceae bacterium]|nr:hypothetical protein [Gemmatimonadaceae bacterium]